MFTSRSEYRLSLRADNADLRLTPQAIRLGIASRDRASAFNKKKKALENSKIKLGVLTITPNEAEKHGIILNHDGIRRTAFNLLGYHGKSFKDIIVLWPELAEIRKDVAEQLEIEASYSSYIERQELEIESFRREQEMKIPESLDYDRLPSLSNEVRQKLKAHRPSTLAAASRIPGITPAAVTILMAHMRRSNSSEAA
jgi:tRNA uridine 5-carboxymethylaminomethyl modification enzyme